MHHQPDQPPLRDKKQAPNIKAMNKYKLSKKENKRYCLLNTSNAQLSFSGQFECSTLTRETVRSTGSNAQVCRGGGEVASAQVFRGLGDGVRASLSGGGGASAQVCRGRGEG